MKYLWFLVPRLLVAQDLLHPHGSAVRVRPLDLPSHSISIEIPEEECDSCPYQIYIPTDVTLTWYIFFDRRGFTRPQLSIDFDYFDFSDYVETLP